MGLFHLLLFFQGGHCSSAKNTHYTNIGCTWEQFVCFCLVYLQTSTYCLGIMRFPPVPAAGL